MAACVCVCMTMCVCRMQWLNSLSSLTHIDLGGTFWILNDYAIDLLVRK